MRPSERLEASLAKIEDPKNWIQNAFAKDADGKEVTSNDSTAVCFCSIGAFLSVHPSTNVTRIPGFKSTSFELLENAMTGNVARFNDSHTHAEVVAAWKTAIVATKEAENETL